MIDSHRVEKKRSEELFDKGHGEAAADSHRRPPEPSDIVATVMKELIGQTVEDQSGQTMGQVTDSVFNCTTGCLTHLVLTRDGSTIYVPWRALRVDATGNQVGRLIIRHLPR